MKVLRATRRSPTRLPCMLAMLSMLAPLALSSGCVNGDFRFQEVELDASIDVDPAYGTPEQRMAAEVHFQAHLAVSAPGEGDLEHPLGEFDRWVEMPPEDAPVTTTSKTLYVPLHRGEGLVIYAWIDLDGDGVLCAPDSEPEPAGLVEVSEFPVFATAPDILLDAPCKGPEALYP